MMFDQFVRSYAEMGVIRRFLAKFRSRYTHVELDATLGAHSGGLPLASINICNVLLNAPVLKFHLE